MPRPHVSDDAIASEARSLLPPEFFDYASGGAGDDSTTEHNVRRLDSFSVVPRIMRDVSEIDTRTTVVGGAIAAPLLAAPMGMQEIYHESAERGTAAATGESGLGFCLSTFTSCSPDQVVRASGHQVRWRQLYILKDRGLTDAMLESAVAAGYDAIVCTVDVPVMGVSRRSAGTTLSAPEDSEPAAVPSDAPVPALAHEPYFTELLARQRRARPGATPHELIDSLFPHPGCTWKDLEELIARSPLPVIVKGVLHPDDAAHAVRTGAAAVVVSNHGGYQHDRSVTSVDALPAVVEAVGGDVPIYFDSGVRRGSHVAAALALGADAALVGRPVLWGLTVGGQQGVGAVLGSLIDELRNTMAIAGATTIAELRRCPVVDTGGRA